MTAPVRDITCAKHIMVQWKPLRFKGVEQFVGNRGKIVRLNVERSIIAMGFWDDIKPGLCVESLGLEKNAG